MTKLNTATRSFVFHCTTHSAELEEQKVHQGLSELLPLENGDISLACMVTDFLCCDLIPAELLLSWLSGNNNTSLSLENLEKIIPKKKLKTFVDLLSIEEAKALDALRLMLPELIDFYSEDGMLNHTPRSASRLRV